MNRLPTPLKTALLALGVLVLLLWFFSPPLAAWRAWSRADEIGFLPEVRRGTVVLEQINALGAPVADPLHGAVQWRVLFPALGHVLSLPSWVIFSFAHVGAWLALWSLAERAKSRGASWTETAALVVIGGAAAWFFAATGWLGYYDSWIVLGLAMVTVARRREWVWLACLATPWIDERFVLAVPLALLARHLDGGAERRAAWKSEWGVPLALIGLFAVVRLWLLPGTSGNATVAGYLAWLDLAKTPWTQFGRGILEGWRVAWGLAALALWAVARNHGPKAAFTLGAAAVVVLGVALATAQDFGRSTMLLAPLIWLGAGAWNEWAAPRRPLALGGAVALTLLWPAHHVMSDATMPVRTLTHELSALEEPPPRLSPAAYELSGVVEMERGNPQKAEIALTIAIKLDAAPTSACKHRGLLYASAQRWQDALRDFQTWADNDPRDPDAGLLVAQAEAALGHTAEARAALRRAMEIAPEGWAKRPDVARFAARLGL